MTDHAIKYERSTVSGNWSATCSCGWMDVQHAAGEIIKRAEAHIAGTEWIEADPHAAVVTERITGALS
jgi:hypothetical protein